MRVGLMTGVFMPPDAISYAVAVKLRALREIFGPDLQYRIYCHASNQDDPAVIRVDSAADVAMDPFFTTCDLVIYEFGITYPLFDSVFVVPGHVPTVGIYHNITPERLFQTTEQRCTIRRSISQRQNLARCSRIFCDSDYNLEDLLKAGIPPAKLDVLHLPLKDQFQETLMPRRSTGRLEALFVGRFVPPKGLSDAIYALQFAKQLGLPACRLTFVGDTTFSDPDYISAIRSLIERAGEDSFRFVGGVSEKDLQDEYRQAHVFLIPSYHEGFCLPVIEAMSSGCVVAGYDAGHLPRIASGLGRIVPAGDWRALGRALHELGSNLAGDGACLPTDTGAMPVAEYHRRTREHLSQFTYPAFRERFRTLLEDRLGLVGSCA